MTLFKINNVKIKVNFSLLILSVIWIYAGQGSVLFTMITVVALHEFFHVFVARLLGLTTEKIELYIFGGEAEIRNINDNYTFEAIIASSGPFLSLFSGFLWERGNSIGILPQWHDFVVFSYSIALINLLPVYPLDGGRVLGCIFKSLFGEKRGKVLIKVSGITVASVFLIKCVFELFYFKKSDYIVMAVFMFTASITATKNPRSTVFREKYWKSEKVKIIKAYENDKIIECLNNMSGNYFYCVIAVDEKENVLGFFTEKQLLDGVMNNTETTFKEYCP